MLAFAVISASVDHLKTGSKSISAGGDVVVPYSGYDFHNDLEIEIPASLVSMVVLAAGPVGGWVLRNRKPRLAFALSPLLVVVSLVVTFLLALLLVFS